MIDFNHTIRYNGWDVQSGGNMGWVSMAAKERLEQIVTLVSERGYVSVGELGETFQVSEMTVRRDLDRLEKENRLRRTFGGQPPFPARPYWMEGTLLRPAGLIHT